MRLTALLALLPALALAEVDVRLSDADMFPENVTYDPRIPVPGEFLGFELGAEPVRHHQLVEYIRTVASLSDRLSIETIGYSHERRPILFLVATDPGNHARLADIRAKHATLSSAGSAAQISDDMPVVTWLNYGVHGAESSGMDAALPFVYYLAAAQNDEIDSILSDSVILVTAIFNPDGHSKRVAWFDAFGGKRRIADPAHMEHQYSWTFARTNHYWFDLNRQWLLLTQPEPKAWMQKWHMWRPNLTVDYHEMGSGRTYYFHPGVMTRTNPLVPERAEELMAETAKFSEDVLDREGRLYFQGERFDNYYVGKGSTFPLVNGGVGMLYEAGAALGRELETANGLRTFRENIRKHFRTSIASIRAAASQREDYLRYQRSFYENAQAQASKSDVKAWVFSASGDSVRLRTFRELLKTHRIDAYAIKRDIVVDGVRFAQDESMVVPVEQPQYTLIRSIFETLDTFEDATFYDVSTWTLPPAFGLDYAALGSKELRGLAGAEFVHGDESERVAESGYGYIVDWSSYYAPKAVFSLLEQGLMANVAMSPFEVETTDGPAQFPRGSIFVPLDRQPVAVQDILDAVRDADAMDGVAVHALSSGRSLNGTEGVNVGGPSFVALSEPSILLLIGGSISYYDAGEIWHLLDYRMDIPVTLRDIDDFSSIDWSRYTHIVLPSGDYTTVDVETGDRLRQWVEEGGTAIAFESASDWLLADTINYVPEDLTMEQADVEDEQADEEQPKDRFDYASKDDREAVDLLGGAIFKADLDITHPLGFGYLKREISLHKNFKDVFERPANPYSTVIQYRDDPLYSGYASDTNVEALASTPALIAERYGQGSVIVFADNPNFRGYWYGTNKLFLNTLFFSKAFSAPSE